MEELKECKIFRDIKIEVRFHSKTVFIDKEYCDNWDDDVWRFFVTVSRPAEYLPDKKYLKLREKIKRRITKIVKEIPS